MLRFRLVWQIPAALFILAAFLLLGNECVMARSSKRTKDVRYVATTTPDFDAERHILDVYAPRRLSATKCPVVVFIHGGSWNSGSKNIYTFVGRRLAKQGVVAVIINYRLAPAVLVPAMADDCARAVLWTKNHVADYGGDPARIFLMGHSAGGGLSALLASDDALFAKLGLTQNPVKGAILDDAAGLDMYDYLTKMEYPNDRDYLIPYGKDPAVWKSTSAMYHIKAGTPPMLLYAGERTYPSIAGSTRTFNQRLEALGIQHTFRQVPGKKHVAMVLQLYWKNNVIYRDLLKFVGA